MASAKHQEPEIVGGGHSKGCARRIRCQPDASLTRALWRSWADKPANGGQTVARELKPQTLWGLRRAVGRDFSAMKTRITVTVDLKIDLAAVVRALALFTFFLT